MASRPAPRDVLHRDEWSGVQGARDAMAAYIDKRYPPRTARTLLAVAISGAFADLCADSSPAGIDQLLSGHQRAARRRRA